MLEDQIPTYSQIGLKVITNTNKDFFINGRVLHEYDEDWTQDLPPLSTKKNLARYEVPDNII